MSQQICQRICSSFLLTLLFLQAATSTSTISAISDCQHLMKSSQCQCLPTSADYEIQCPAMVQNPKIKISVFNRRMSGAILKCNQFNDVEYQLLPAMNIGDVEWFYIEDCPLPSKPISQLLTHMGLKQFDCLKFENHISPSNLTREHFDGLNDLKGLLLDVTDLSHIRENLFMDLTNLDTLIIQSSKMSLSRDIFAALVELVWLKLEIKNLQQLPVGIFRNQRMLQILQVDQTLLRNISKNLFEDTKYISELSLRSNGIKSFPSDVFSLLTRLTEIDLSNNDFWELPSGIFAHNKQLGKVLMINSKSLKALPPGLFSNLPNLYSAVITCDVVNSANDANALSLTDENIVRINCDLDEIPYDLFANSSKITEISLAKNKLVTLTAALFEHQVFLTYLDLSHNRLESLSDELFRYTTQLTVLNLSHNYLTKISSHLFYYLIKLVKLHLNDNRIKTIEYVSFLHNKNLQSIYMENNLLNMSDAFENIRGLQTLNLRNNSLRNIFRGYGLIKLQELDLSHNFITTLNYGDLLFHSNNTLSINLNSNRISKIKMTYDVYEVSPEVLNKKLFLTVQLNNNPMDCDCNLLPFLQYVRGDLNGMPHSQPNFEISNLVCDRPDRMKNLKLLDIEPKALLCPFNLKKFQSRACPLGCVCWERTYDAVLLVNCSSINLTEVPVLPNVQQLGFESIELHVESNELKELPIVSTSGYEDVTRIYATGNNLSRIDVNNLPMHLIYLDLSRNNIKELNKNVLDFFKANNSLQEIALSENPWNCDCESKPLMQFVGRSYKMIADIDRLYCASPKNTNMIEYFNSNDICPDGPDGLSALITAMLSILGVSLAIAIVAAIFYKYQTEIKIWLYKYNLCSWWVNEEEVDKDKIYDAFVSYSSRDDEFVLGRLVPELEKGSIRFKLCVHVRDFIVGDIISDQIIRAIADSRRTIVVLSKHFIKSVWARMEFRLAHQAGLDEKRAKVIAIVYGDIGDISLLDLELQAYLKMTTYLEWGNPWFWERLRYTMPHPKRRNDVNALSTGQNAKQPDV